MSILLTDIQIIIEFILDNLLAFNFILALIIVFFQRKDPKSVWTWLLILFFIPIVGFVFYLLIGTDMHKQRLFRTKEIEDKLNDAIRKQEYSIKHDRMKQKNEIVLEYEDMILYHLEASGSILTNDNDVEFLTDGKAKFAMLIEDMKKAKESIHVQYYIIREDEVFDEIRDVLMQKASEGVEVRVLYDAMGCRSMKRSYWNKIKEAGVQAEEFFPALMRRFHLRINYRNHRKIVVIDGRVGYVGGFNVGKEYIGLDEKFGYWRDTHLRIEGSAVQTLQVRFLLDWNYASKHHRVSMKKYLQDHEYHSLQNCDIQIVTSGPDSSMQNIRDTYFRLIGKAKKRIYIQTPYFIPDESILTALTVAIYSGIEVRIMIPCKPDHLFVYWATYSYIGNLVLAGAKCYTYDNGFLHAKGMIIDESVLCYGTANMDNRSFALNFEVNAIIYNEDKAKKMIDIFNKDLEQCTHISKDKYLSRSLLIRFKEQISRTLSPLL